MPLLDQIAEGSLSATEARLAIAELPSDLDDVTAKRIYVAFRSWTWKAIDRKRRDPELRDWFDLLKRTQVRLKRHDALAFQIQVLLDLVSESVSVAERRPVADVLSRRNARALLLSLQASPEGTLSKAAIMRALALKQANASRLMNVMLSAGLVERTMDGREALFRLSRSGMEHAQGIQPKAVAAPVIPALTTEDMGLAMKGMFAAATNFDVLLENQCVQIKRLAKGAIIGDQDKPQHFFGGQDWVIVHGFDRMKIVDSHIKALPKPLAFDAASQKKVLAYGR